MRRMKFNHGVEIPRSVWFVVPEAKALLTDPRKGVTHYELKKLYAAHVNYERDKKIAEWTFDEPLEFWNLVSARGRPKRTAWLFVGEPYFDLDLLGFWKLIDEGRIVFRAARNAATQKSEKKTFRGTLCLNSTPFFAHCCLDGRSLTIVSVNNYGEKITDLQKEAETIAISQTATTTTKTRKNNHYRACLQATVYYFTALFDVWRRNEIGCWQTTASKLAMRAYQHHLTKRNAELCNSESDPENRRLAQKAIQKHPRLHLITFHDDNELKTFERQAYFGGEAQLFFVGKWKKPCFYVDVKSFYPWIAAHYELPYCLERVEKKASLEWLRNQLDSYEAIAEVLIAGPGSEYPVRVPLEKIRRRESGVQTSDEHCVVYPEGRYWTTLTALELRDAITKGFVRDVGQVALYKKSFVLRDFMLEWLERREEADRTNDYATAVIAKTVANSLIGKFGQRSPSWKDAPYEVPPIHWGEYWKADWESKTYVRYRSIGGFAQKYCGLVESRYSFIPIAAAVCSIGRHLMRSWRRTMPEDSILLQDTDGWIVTEEGLQRLMESPAFGSQAAGTFRLKGEFEDAEFWTPKHYRLGNDFVLAGFGNARIAKGNSFFFAETTSPFDSLLAGLPIGRALRRLRQFSPDFLYPNRYRLESGFTVPLLLL